MSSKIVVLCGDHPRNIFFAQAVNKYFDLTGVILQEREKMIPNNPNFCSSKDKKNYIKHFENRKIFENYYFGEQNKLIKTNILKVNKNNLSSNNTIEFLDKLNPDIIFVFGVGIITDPLLSFLPKNTINLHSGIIPKYKGTACNFWPFYFLEPNWAGATFHFLIKKVDGGRIIHQVVPELNYGDTIHQVACKSILKACEDIKKVVNGLISGNINGIPQNSSGMLFKNIDFRPEHLRVVYDQYDDNVVDHFLNGDIKPKHPKLVKIDN